MRGVYDGPLDVYRTPPLLSVSTVATHNQVIPISLDMFRTVIIIAMMQLSWQPRGNNVAIS